MPIPRVLSARASQSVELRSSRYSPSGMLRESVTYIPLKILSARASQV